MSRNRNHYYAIGWIIMLAAAVDLWAAEFFVSPSGSDAGAGTSWANAKQTIQAAIDAAAAGDTVWVTNGIYDKGGRPAGGVFTLTNRVVIDKPLTLRSVNGPDSTMIMGTNYPTVYVFNLGPNSVRCVWLTNGASLVGFTLAQGSTSVNDNNGTEENGGGIWCQGTNVIVSNCIFSCNAAWRGGAAFGGTMIDCTFTNNIGYTGSAVRSGMCFNCFFLFNTNLGSGTVIHSVINNCVFSYNHGRGGVFCAGGAQSELNNCILVNNWGSGGCVATLNNCIVVNNQLGADRCILNNCTVVGNQSGRWGAGGTSCSTQLNSIVYMNWGNNYSNGIFINCCTVPMPTNGAGNITNDPVFIDPGNWSGTNFVAGDYRLQSNSPCIDAGSNADLAPGADLAGVPRPLDGNADGVAIMDMGAYEYLNPAADSDGDGMPDGAEVRADTDPTQSDSRLAMLGVDASNDQFRVNWMGGSRATQYLERCVDLTATGTSWEVVFTNLPPTAKPAFLALPPDTNAMGHYRVRVGP